MTPLFMPWRVTETRTETHFHPMEDYRPHDMTARCWCHPEEHHTEPDVWMHTALDGREPYEDGKRGLQ